MKTKQDKSRMFKLKQNQVYKEENGKGSCQSKWVLYRGLGLEDLGYVSTGVKYVFV